MTRTVKKREPYRKRKPAAPVETGYVDCGCRDCFNVAIGAPGAMCWECVEAGCEYNRECLAPGAYGGMDGE